MLLIDVSPKYCFDPVDSAKVDSSAVLGVECGFSPLALYLKHKSI
jgi:hypothetical protein